MWTDSRGFAYVDRYGIHRGWEFDISAAFLTIMGNAWKCDCDYSAEIEIGIVPDHTHAVWCKCAKSILLTILGNIEQIVSAELLELILSAELLISVHVHRNYVSDC